MELKSKKEFEDLYIVCIQEAKATKKYTELYKPIDGNKIPSLANGILAAIERGTFGDCSSPAFELLAKKLGIPFDTSAIKNAFLELPEDMIEDLP